MAAQNANNVVAKELSEALAKCKQKGVDEASLRTGLLTITIANFVNRIGMQNTIGLFSALPDQIASGIFDKYIDPNTNTAAAPTSPLAAPTNQPPPAPPMGYQNGNLPHNFVPPSPTPHLQGAYEPTYPAGAHNPLQNFGPMNGAVGYPMRRRRSN